MFVLIVWLIAIATLVWLERRAKRVRHKYGLSHWTQNWAQLRSLTEQN